MVLQLTTSLPFELLQFDSDPDLTRVGSLILDGILHHVKEHLLDAIRIGLHKHGFEAFLVKLYLSIHLCGESIKNKDDLLHDIDDVA